MLSTGGALIGPGIAEDRVDDSVPFEEIAEVVNGPVPACMPASPVASIETEWLRIATLRAALLVGCPNPEETATPRMPVLGRDRLTDAARFVIRRELPRLLTAAPAAIRQELDAARDDLAACHARILADPRAEGSELLRIIKSIAHEPLQEIAEFIVAATFLNDGPVSYKFLGNAYPDPFAYHRVRGFIQTLVKLGYLQQASLRGFDTGVMPVERIMETIRRQTMDDLPSEMLRVIPAPPLPPPPYASIAEGHDRLVEAMAREVSGRDEIVRILAEFGARHLLGETGLRPLFFVGSTGSGKTHLAQSLARALQVRFARIDLSQVIAQGYVGRSLMDCYWQEAPMRRHETRFPVLLLDEVDKIATRETTFRDIRGTEIQHELLTLLEHTNPGWPTPLIVVAGAFSSGRGLVTAKGSRPREIGFLGGAEAKQNPRPPGASELARLLEKSGLLPELIGRMGQVIPLKAPTSADFRAWLDHPTSPLRSFSGRLGDSGVKFVASERGKDLLAAAAVELGLGLRGVKIILDRLHAFAVANRRKRINLHECTALAR